MIPVDRSSTDPFYRYMMPELQCAYESHQTVLSNIPAIAKSLYREPDHMVRYMGISLGCKSQKENGRFSLKGTFEPKRMQQLVFDFIDLFVLCPKCRNPETRFIIGTGSRLMRTCSSCGETFLQGPSQINNVIERSIGSLSNDDLKYEKSNRSNIHDLIHSPNDESNNIYEVYTCESLTPSDLFCSYVRPSELPQLSRILHSADPTLVLSAIEDMLESSEKWNKLPHFLRALLKMGWKIEAVEEYFSKPRKARKRSAMIKRGYEQFMIDYEDQ